MSPALCYEARSIVRVYNTTVDIVRQLSRHFFIQNVRSIAEVEYSSAYDRLGVRGLLGNLLSADNFSGIHKIARQNFILLEIYSVIDNSLTLENIVRKPVLIININL